MHTLIVIGIGFLTLAACALLGHTFSGSSGTATGLLVFLPLWLIGAGVNLAIGVRQAGYTLAEEAPIFLLVFAVPAAAALLLWWRLK
jgi:hypothetical protein